MNRITGKQKPCDRVILLTSVRPTVCVIFVSVFFSLTPPLQGGEHGALILIRPNRFNGFHTSIFSGENR